MPKITLGEVTSPPAGDSSSGKWMGRHCCLCAHSWGHLSWHRHLTHTQGSETLFENVRPLLRRTHIFRGRRSDCCAWESSSTDTLFSVSLATCLISAFAPNSCSVCADTRHLRPFYCCLLYQFYFTCPRSNLLKFKSINICWMKMRNKALDGNGVLLTLLSRADVFEDLHTLHSSLWVVLSGLNVHPVNTRFAPNIVQFQCLQDKWRSFITPPVFMMDTLQIWI